MNCRFSNICTNAASVWWPSETDDSNVSGETEATKWQLLWWRQFHLIVMVLICKCPLLAVKIGFAFISLFVCFLHFCLRLIQMPCDRKCEQQKTESSLLSTLTQQHTVQQAQRKANNATQWIIIFHYWKKKKNKNITVNTCLVASWCEIHLLLWRGVRPNVRYHWLHRHNYNAGTQCIWFFTLSFLFVFRCVCNFQD